MEIISGMCVILLGGLVAGKIVQILKLPAITGYTLFGIFMGPYAFNFLSQEIIGASQIMSYIVLGVVAFSIGESFSIKFLRKLGKVVMWISIIESVTAWIFVTLTFLLILRQPLYVSLIFGAIASATAPAATMAVIRELRAKGTFTDVLLSVVAIDDAWCLIIFSISLIVSKYIYYNIEIESLFSIISRSFLEIFGALALGSILSVFFVFFSRFIRREEELLILTVGFIVLGISLASRLNFSLLLTCMAMGMVANNTHRSSYKIFNSLRKVDMLLYTAFFVLIGANFEIDIIKKEISKVGLFIIAFMIARWSGKMIGAWLGAIISTAPEKIRKFLGYALVPQAGVALGVAMIAKAEFPQVGGFVLTVIIAKTIINELIGPPFSRYALIKSGETQVE